MQFFKRSTVMLVTLVLALLLFGCTNSETESKDLVARVNGEGISQEQLDERMDQFKAYMQSQGLDLESEAHGELIGQMEGQVLDGLIQEVLFRQYTQEQGIEVEREEVDTQIDEMRQMIGEEQFAQLLEAQNMTEASLREQIEQSLLSEIVFENVTDDVQVTEEETTSYFEENKSDLAKADVRHILILADETASSEEKEKARAKAQEVIDKLEAGEDFAELAQEYSEDPGSKVDGGKLPQPVRRNDPNYVPGFVAGVWDLEEGEYSLSPVSSRYGFHVIKVEKIMDTFPELESEIENNMTMEKKDQQFKDFLDELNQSAEIEILKQPQTEEETETETETEN